MSKYFGTDGIRGKAGMFTREFLKKIVEGLRVKDKKVLMLSIGSMTQAAAEAYPVLSDEGYKVTIVNMRFAKPLDVSVIEKYAPKSDVIVTLEENSVAGGVSEKIAAYMQWNGLGDKKCIPISLPDAYIEHGHCEMLKEKYNLTAEYIAEAVRSSLN